jgi:hypothetical protein
MMTILSAMFVLLYCKVFLFRVRWATIVALCGVVLLVLAQGCSALRLGYGTAPDLAYWWLDRYVDFNSTQTPRARAALTQWFAWHRRTQLPDYAALLMRARSEVLADTTAARACEWQTDVLRRVQTAFENAAPAAADLVLTFTPAQIQHLQRRQTAVNDDFRDEYLQPNAQERAAANFKRTLGRVEMIYGPLNEAQQAQIKASLARSPFDPEIWLAERKLRQQEVVQLLTKLSANTGSANAANLKSNNAQALAALRGYVDQLERSPRAPYRKYVERLTEFNCAFAANLHNTTTPAQRQTAKQNLAGWEGDMRALAAGAEVVTAPGATPGQ